MEIQARGFVTKCEIRVQDMEFMTEGHRFMLTIQGLPVEEGDQLAIPGAISVYSTYPMAVGTAVMVELKSPERKAHDGEA